eukprot:CAMPEP_0114977286 /NCGR_PEP_ID=MMETSP0216-20121206/3153_1 /TAXON_ID=223996 /ORGANISM="Protocruzia adherens, Strain Boccale" /LENGTH=103 /DNA_ID=CAMNT_0002338327 /DNA_START=684 /DNA_END=995 /DNA_ORIENTATION=-
MTVTTFCIVAVFVFVAITAAFMAMAVAVAMSVFMSMIMIMIVGVTETVVMIGAQSPCHEDVDSNTNHSSDSHNSTVNFNRVNNSSNGFRDEPYCEHPDDENTT